MFVLTLGKKSLRRLGAAAVCGIALAGAVLAVSGFIHAGDGALEASASAAQNPAGLPETIAGAEDISAFFGAFGLEVDLTGATVDKVKVPKKWDESFSAFNGVVKQSGFDLSQVKGKTVEKWLAECPARSTGEETCKCVLLVYKEKPVGAYLLNEPSGEVQGLADAAATPAPLTDQQAAQTAAGFGEQAAQTSADEAVPAPAEQQIPADSQAQQVSGDEIMEFDAASVGAVPVE